MYMYIKIKYFQHVFVSQKKKENRKYFEMNDEDTTHQNLQDVAKIFIGKLITLNTYIEKEDEN